MNFDLLKNAVKSSFKNTSNLTTVSIVIFLFIFVIFISFIRTFNNPKIVTFDFRKTQELFLKEEASSKLSKEQITVLGTRFPLAVEKAVKEYSVNHKVVVLVKNAVMAGAYDATPEIQQLIAQEMQLANMKKTVN